MTTLDLLNELHKRTIHLRCVGDELKVRGPKGALTPELRAALVEHKPVLLALLTAEERLRSMEAREADQVQPVDAQEVLAEAAISLMCCVCGAEVACYSDQGVAYCEKHWGERLQSLVNPWLVPTEDALKLVRTDLGVQNDEISGCDKAGSNGCRDTGNTRVGGTMEPGATHPTRA